MLKDPKFKNKVGLILTHENTRELIKKFGSNIAQHFNNKFSKLLNDTTDSLSFLQSQNISEFLIDKDNVHFNIMFTPIINMNEFDFIKFFDSRIKNNLSYIDPKKCLNTFVNSYIFKSEKRTSDTTLNNVVFALYLHYKEPMYSISDTLLQHAVTDTHNMILFDVSGNTITLENCLDEILQFFPLAPRNPTFIQRFNKNPKKLL